MGMINFRNTRLGITLVELLITISVISVGIFPLITALGNISETAMRQRDQLSAMMIGNLIMDSWLAQFQLMRPYVQKESDYDVPITIYSPGRDAAELGFPRNDGLTSKEILYNKGFFRVTSTFTNLNGKNTANCLPDQSQTPELSNNENLIFAIEVVVWKITTPEVSETIGLQEVQTRGRGPVPGFEKGDERMYQVCSLYSQSNRFATKFQ